MLNISLSVCQPFWSPLLGVLCLGLYPIFIGLCVLLMTNFLFKTGSHSFFVALTSSIYPRSMDLSGYGPPAQSIWCSVRFLYHSLRLGKFSSVIFFSVFSAFLCWDSSLSVPIILRFGLYMVFQIFWMFCVWSFSDLIFSLMNLFLLLYLQHLRFSLPSLPVHLPRFFISWIPSVCVLFISSFSIFMSWIVSFTCVFGLFLAFWHSLRALLISSNFLSFPRFL